jgi:hypothetical protein
MNQIKTALEKGMSREQERIINILVGITMASGLEDADKRDCINFIRDVEAYIDFDGFEE